jgi:predicted LPLAT superfamily acyltransferase
MVEKKWGGTTYGNSQMHRWLIRLLRWLPIRLIYVLAYIFAVPPTLTKPGFRHAMQFFRQNFGSSKQRAFWLALKNHCLFAQAVIDKFAMYAGRHFEIELEGYEHFLELAEKPDGFVQLSSHVGNYEIAGYSLVAEKKRFNALVFSGEKEEVMSNRARLFEHANIRMIPIKPDMSHLFEINSALADGETVSIPADRIWGSQKYVAKTFLGREAHLPMGPFQVVAMRSVEVLVVHVMKASARRYKIIVTPISYDKDAPRQQQIEQIATGYVNELERIVRLYPTQWYNYFDFWTQ